ncbi:hypothetical protein [Acidithiobacillus albertensis]|uniref:hypothetical protein n=1 Tax=Acidithiobacillus albertensis TaxID=119978 RepID=UPI001C07BD02|nr:hypothetical protein [Acidithiobacillus albertensis]MBU2741279.1 hypothetical protein [Acidithiobacillus albertensis]
MIKSKQHFVAIVRPDLLWFLLGDFAAESAGIFDKPDDPEGTQLLHSIYLETQRAMFFAVKSGDLPARAWPLWNKVPPPLIEEYASDANPDSRYGIAISELHEWLQSTGYPLAKNPLALYEVFKRRWAAIVDDPTPERVTVNPADGQPFQVVGFKQVPHGKKAKWFAESTTPTIRDAIDALGLEATRPQIIKWACDTHKGTTDGSWKKHINTAEIAAVKNEKREK